MHESKAVAQWELRAVVFHSQNFGHSISFSTQTKGRDRKFYEGGRWRGLGIPTEVLKNSRALLDGIFTEHLITRYSLRDELSGNWDIGPHPE